MHDVDQTSCADCRFFTLAYPDAQGDRRLRDWGGCTRAGQATLPPADVSAGLRRAVLDGDRQALRRNVAGLYRSEPGDGCEQFEEVIAEAGAAGGG